jgi:ABC-type phosphonate transport system ATPase subunit
MSKFLMYHQQPAYQMALKHAYNPVDEPRQIKLDSDSAYLDQVVRALVLELFRTHFEDLFLKAALPRHELEHPDRAQNLRNYNERLILKDPIRHIPRS